MFKSYCAECERLGHTCAGDDSSTPYNNCVSRETWLDVGRTVRMKKACMRHLGAGKIMRLVFFAEMWLYEVEFVTDGRAHRLLCQASEMEAAAE